MKNFQLKKIILLSISLFLLASSLMAKEHKMNPKKYDVFARETQLSLSITFSCKAGKIPEEISVWSAHGPFDQSLRLYGMTLVNERELIYKPSSHAPEILVGTLDEALLQTAEEQDACLKGEGIYLDMRKLTLDSNFGVYIGVKNVECFYNDAGDKIPFSGIKNAVSYTLFTVDEANKKVFYKEDYRSYKYENGKCVNAKTILIGTGRVLLTPFMFLGWIIIGMP